MSEIIVKEVQSRRELREFIHLPAKVHKGEPGWLPPLYSDEWHLFDKKKNRSYNYSDAAFFLAWKDGKPVGRIMTLINNRYNEIKNEKHGRFSFMECYNDREIFHALITKAEEWVRNKGMVKIVGPMGFSDKDPQGFQIEGFEYPYLFTAPTNSPYMPALLEEEGYTKEIDLVNYNLPIPESYPSVYLKALERYSRNGEITITEFKSKKEIKPIIIPVLELMNQTFINIYGYVPLNDAEKEEFASRYLPVLDPEFVKIAKSKNEFVGFVVALPDLTPGIIAARGKLFPLGILRILKEMKKSTKLMLMLGGVREDYRGKGIDVMMAMKLIESARKHNKKTIDSHLIMELNARMRAECERMNGKIVKRFRIFQKSLVD
jgi:GNAT superfamily N-acetyltransferase